MSGTSESRPGRKFTEESKADAVAIVEESGGQIAKVARELGIHESSLGNWLGQIREEAAGALASPRTPRQGTNNRGQVGPDQTVVLSGCSYVLVVGTFDTGTHRVAPVPEGVGRSPRCNLRATSRESAHKLRSLDLWQACDQRMWSG